MNLSGLPSNDLIREILNPFYELIRPPQRINPQTRQLEPCGPSGISWNDGQESVMFTEEEMKLIIYARYNGYEDNSDWPTEYEIVSFRSLCIYLGQRSPEKQFSALNIAAWYLQVKADFDNQHRPDGLAPATKGAWWLHEPHVRGVDPRAEEIKDMLKEAVDRNAAEQ